ncbi:hypothetical protein BD311DRAFT_767655 [Dichomitus squalens]|uniref:Uncharacterized protein n=1 Tax=Dichomitus squalens TaxID=114155 RepID=A0A4Q9M9P9_9APHY|nr:hypothetical protein BD311DRAFT_767655 [Dichomitus squalens]
MYATLFSPQALRGSHVCAFPTDPVTCRRSRLTHPSLMPVILVHMLPCSPAPERSLSYFPAETLYRASLPAYTTLATPCRQPSAISTSMPSVPSCPQSLPHAAAPSDSQPAV